MYRPLLPHALVAAALAVLAVLASLVPRADATALTFPIAAHENLCYYVMAPEQGTKISFYFAVQTGGTFDIDFLVSDPDYNVVISGEKERQGDFVFAAQMKGEYSFCFSNGMSTFAQKIIDIELSVEGEHLTRASIPAPKPNLAKGSVPDTSVSEETIFRISSQMNSYSRSQKYYHTRERRSLSTVESTERRIWWFAILESALMVAMAVLQVYVVRTFFRGYGGKGRL
ncbi:hypothetical protein H9P43_002975 [Blastocladiella emersonii ATCC 22665]|nr:hypothetical protein H9P43_002975 [Blastocladiella emersonii ATCC 22665]